MNDNTILRIKVPAHLYESVKQQLTLNEAKAKPHYGAGMEVVKEKKMKVPKDGMKKMEEEKVEETVSEAAIDPNLIGGILGILLGGGPIVATILKQYKDAKTPEEKAEVLKQASQAIGGKMSGKMEEKKEVEEAKDEEKKEAIEEAEELNLSKHYRAGEPRVVNNAIAIDRLIKSSVKDMSKARELIGLIILLADAFAEQRIGQLKGDQNWQYDKK